MRRIAATLGILMLSPLVISWAQLRAPNEAGVAMGQWYTIVRNVEATKKFWVLFGGMPVKIGGSEAMKFPGVFIFMTQGEPSGGSVGSSVNHVGFGALNVRNLVSKLQEGGVTKIQVNKSPLNGQDVAHLDSPDGLEIEITEEAGVDPYPRLPPGTLLESNHIHFGVPREAREAMQAWYVKVFGAKPRTLGQELTGAVPGVGFMRYGFTQKEYLPTKGRALDHLGFEVKNLAAFCKKLEANGVKLDQPYSKSRHKGFASAELTDPWGTSIELTEGLNRY